MAAPQLLQDLIALMLLLAPSVAVICLVLAGISLHQSSVRDAFVGSNFAKHMFWAIVFLTFPQLLAWFPGFGIPVPLPAGGVSTGWMANFATDFSNFVSNFVITRLATVLAAFLVLRAIIETVQGGHPLPSILGAMFLLSVQSTLTLMKSYNSHTQYATADMLDSLWNYLAGTICPIAAGLAIVGGIWNFVTRRPVMPMIGATIALLTVSGIWKLVNVMM
jgi:hypothetical protein